MDPEFAAGDVIDESVDSSALARILTPGELVANRFSVRKLARRGGMGAIYQGVDLESGDSVAIKIVDGLDVLSAARFSREAQILAEMSHPNVVRHLSHGTTAAGMPYLVMEWLDGEDLSERLAREPLGIDESLALIRRVCEPMALLHARGIVHRDIKPANLFLPGADPGAVKILDFGIARFERMTQTVNTDGALIGTIGYMAPEQAMCERDVDSRADVFAIGCVLYECLTGKPPFASSNAVGVLAKVLREEPRRPSELRPEVDARIDALVSRLLAKNRNDRPPDAGAILSDLRTIEARSRDAAPRSRPLLPTLPNSEQRVISVILGKPPIGGGGALASRQDDDAIRELSAKFSAEIAPLRGGAILLVLTGKGEANDQASQAAHCALELRRLRPDLMLAVATGLADTSERVPVGAAIDRAAALLGYKVSSAAGVPIDEVTSGLIGRRFDVQRSAAMTLLVGARRDFDAPRVLMGRPTPCLGRDREVAMLDGVLEECVSDCVSRTVLVTGPPGIGKSRLAEEWLAQGRHAGGVRTLVARPDPGSAGSALSLVQQLLRHAAGLREADPAEVQLARLREHLPGGLDDRPEEPIVDFLAEVANPSAKMGSRDGCTFQ
jgi:serine/threonine protein kinase